MEIQDFRVHVQRRQRPGSDDHGLEPLEDGLHRDRTVQTTEVEHRVQDRRCFVVVGLDDDGETFGVAREQRRQVRDQDEGREVGDVGDLHGAQQRRQTLGAKSQRLSFDANFGLHVAQEGGWRFLDDVLDAKARFQVFHEALQEGHEVLRVPYVAGDDLWK